MEMAAGLFVVLHFMIVYLIIATNGDIRTISICEANIKMIKYLVRIAAAIVIVMDAGLIVAVSRC